MPLNIIDDLRMDPRADHLWVSLAGLVDAMEELLRHDCPAIEQSKYWAMRRQLYDCDSQAVRRIQWYRKLALSIQEHGLRRGEESTVVLNGRNELRLVDGSHRAATLKALDCPVPAILTDSSGLAS